jgi:hypothetical protein
MISSGWQDTSGWLRRDDLQYMLRGTEMVVAMQAHCTPGISMVFLLTLMLCDTFLIALL